MHFPRFLATLLAFAFMGTGVALASVTNLDENANDPTYEPKSIRCKGGSCKAYVINRKGIGVEVKGKNKKKTKKKAQAEADRLNAEAEENTVSQDDDGVFDVCLMFPQMC